MNARSGPIGAAPRAAIAWLAVVAAFVAPAAWAADASGERARIAGERAQAQARFIADERACQARFGVSACIERARIARRETLEQLEAQGRVLDEAERKRRASDRLQRIREKVDASSERAASAPRR
jgi:colicin import membrane protein